MYIDSCHIKNLTFSRKNRETKTIVSRETIQKQGVMRFTNNLSTKNETYQQDST